MGAVAVATARNSRFANRQSLTHLFVCTDYGRRKAPPAGRSASRVMLGVQILQARAGHMGIDLGSGNIPMS